MQKKIFLQKNFGLRLKTQLVIFFMGLMTLMMSSVILITYKRTEVVLEEQSAALTQQYFDQSEYNLVTYAKEIDKMLLSLSQINGVTEYLENGWENSSDVILELSEILDSARKITSSYEEVESVFFFGKFRLLIMEVRYKKRTRIHPGVPIGQGDIPLLILILL